jgi:hypothetical protein
MHLGVPLNNSRIFELLRYCQILKKDSAPLSQNIYVCVFAMKNINQLPFILKGECAFCEPENIASQRNVQFTEKKIGSEYKSVQVFQISRSYPKILGAQCMNTKQFRTQHPQVLADTAQNCVAPTDW